MHVAPLYCVSRKGCKTVTRSTCPSVPSTCVEAVGEVGGEGVDFVEGLKRFYGCQALGAWHSKRPV